MTNVCRAWLRHPRLIGMLCASGSVALGLVYLVCAGAPLRYVGINVGALVIGLTMLALLSRTAVAGERWAGPAVMAMAGVLLITAGLGERIDGASRWVRLGGLSIQPSLVFLPLMIVTFARFRDRLAGVGLIVAAVALAIQPDRAMAAMLAAGLIALAVMRPGRLVILAAGAAVAGFATTMVRADTLPAAPYVEQIIYSSFDVHIIIGAAVLAGCFLILVPAIIGWYGDRQNRETYAAFGTIWLVAVLAAALGNYPTPLVGYGASAIIGYILSLLPLPGVAVSRTLAGNESRG